MPETQAAELKPEVEASCVVCSGAARELICSAAEARAQRDYLRRFHRRRLRPACGRRDAHALADRAEFTQDYITEIVSCRDCGLLLREPRLWRVAASFDAGIAPWFDAYYSRRRDDDGS